MTDEPTFDVSGAERRLADVEAALERIEDGSYGRCAACGGPIDDAVLASDPLTSLCAGCRAGGSGGGG